MILLPAGNIVFVSTIEAIFKDAKGSLRGGRPPTTGALLRFDMPFASLIHLAGDPSVVRKALCDNGKLSRHAMYYWGALRPLESLFTTYGVVVSLFQRLINLAVSWHFLCATHALIILHKTGG
jgi:hypothetical protein